MCLTEEKLNRNYLLWMEYLKKYDCYSQELIDELGDKIKNASFSMNEISGSAYQGSMIDVVLSTLCTIAVHINENAFGVNDKGKEKHPRLKVDTKSLMKVLLLQHISKAEFFIPVAEQWKINKGILYDFNPSLSTSLKLGERSIYLCMKYNISLTEEEYEAMRILDKDDDKTNSFVTPLCEIVKISNQLAAIDLYQKNKKINKQETLEQ